MNKSEIVVPLVDHTDPEQSIPALVAFRETLAQLKISPPHPQFAWYPYDTLSNWWLFRSLWGADFVRLREVLKHRSVLDIGCGDGDLAFFLESLGCEVTAVDHPPYNFNHMHGVRALKERLSSTIEILDVNLDSETPLELPKNDYGLVLLLGILYHLKNPFSILEKIARRARFCLLSTRIAAVTPTGVPMQNEALAYLLDSREANDDPTNYWIFSETGLLRLLKRSSWEVRGMSKFGCTSGSNPSRNDADERMFLILRSKTRSAPARFELLKGWWATETSAEWRWVDKNFTLDIYLEEREGASEFELAFTIAQIEEKALPLTMNCRANDMPLEATTYQTFGDQIYRSHLPEVIDRTKAIRLEFSVQHEYRYKGDARDLGVIIPCRGDILGTNSAIGLWIA